MLAAVLIAGIVAAPVSSAALFVPVYQRGRVVGWWPATRQLVLALVGTAVLAVLIAAVLLLDRASRVDILAAVAAFGLVSVVWLPATRRWNARAHLCWASSLLLFVGYLAFILQWTLASGLGPASTAGGVLLWVFEAFAALLGCAYLWELCDTLGTEHWRRRVPGGTAAARPAAEVPFVSLHVPAHNEPPEMVIQTLESLLRIDYPRFEVVVVDDNTDDERLWRPVADWCERHDVTFAHLENWPGFKAGALNYALRELTDPRAEVVGVVDSDYQIDPRFLSSCAPLLADERVGFIQSPQDYHGWQQAPYFRRLYYSYEYFFTVSQPSRNERDGAIFAGTMGLIRRQALQAVGGWEEACITEDADLSLRLLRAGWTGWHVDRSFGRGVMPLTFEALKSQRYRWCFGGIQILRMHARSLLPGPRTGSNRLTLGQRWAYLSGGLQWYGDLVGLAFYAFLLAGAANLATGGGQLFRKLTAFLVATIPVLVALGLLRAIALIRRGTRASWREALGAYFVWQSTSLVVARASVQGLFGRRATFLRTPKTGEDTTRWQALRANWAETVLGLLGLLGIVAALTRVDGYSGPLLAGLLVFPTLGFAAAPVNSLAARRAALPAELRQRRRSEWVRAGTARRRAAGGGLLGAVTALAAVLALLLVPSPSEIRPPQLFGPGPEQPGATPANSTPGGSGRSGGPAAPGSPTGSAPGGGPSVPVPSVPVPSVRVPSPPVPSLPVPSLPVPSVPLTTPPLPKPPVPSVPLTTPPLPPAPSLPLTTPPLPKPPAPSLPATTLPGLPR